MSRKIFFKRMWKSHFFKIGLLGLILILVSCFVLPVLVQWDPTKTVLSDKYIPPEGLKNGFRGHVLGTDPLGRDMLARLLIGGQYSLRLALTAVAFQALVGSSLGIIAGYYGGNVDMIIMRACDAMMTMPSLLLAIVIMAVFGTSERNLLVVLTITSWVRLCKVTRNSVRLVKQQEFVLASRALGAKGPHIMFKRILPNTTTNIIIQTSQAFGIMILMEASLSYLNLGIQPPAPSWGNMISAGRIHLATQPYLVIVPGIALMITVLSFNFLGDGIRDILDTKRKI